MALGSGVCVMVYLITMNDVQLVEWMPARSVGGCTESLGNDLLLIRDECIVLALCFLFQHTEIGNALAFIFEHDFPKRRS